MENIVGYKLKKKILSYEDRGYLLNLATLLIKGEDNEYMPTLKKFAFDIVILDAYFEFTNDKGEIVNIITVLNTDELYDLVYKFDYKELDNEIIKRQIKDLKETFEDLISYELMMIEIEQNRSSKYDYILDSILEMIDRYKNVFDNLNVEEFVNDVSMLSKKLKNVTQENVVKEIVKTMKAHPINKENKKAKKKKVD